LIFNKNLVISAVLLALSACATVTAPPSIPSTTSGVNQKHLATLVNIKAFSLKGRLGVVTQKQGFSGGMEWQHQTNNDNQASLDNIDVFSPVGGKVANIAKNPSGVTLTSQDGHSIKAQDAESLTEATLGWKLPLNGLSDWALGKPTASKIEASSWDEQGKLLTLKQDGWDINYENYTENNGIFLPSKIVLKSEKVNLKLLVEKWISTGNLPN
jgi:outer membrane lipoprotein LolB